MKKILICGNMGYRTNQIDGQTVKTRMLKDYLLNSFGEKEVKYVDTSFVKVNPVKNFYELYRHSKSSRNIIILPGANGIIVLLPFFTLLMKIYHFNLYYVVIGGWLPDFLEKHKWLQKLCRKIRYIYVEIGTMKRRLNNMGYCNIKVLPNFRESSPIFKEIILEEDAFRLVYFSRVIKEKGVALLIQAVNTINERYNNLVKLDVYGPIGDKYKDEFYQLIEGNKNIQYKGVINPKEVTANLSSYELMAFPTFYEGEGFPGAIIDAFMSGVPVLASDWKYNREIVNEEVTGFLFKTNDVNDLMDKLNFLINSRNYLYSMRKSCAETAQNYFIDNVLKEIMEDLNEQDFKRKGIS